MNEQFLLRTVFTSGIKLAMTVHQLSNTLTLLAFKTTIYFLTLYGQQTPIYDTLRQTTALVNASSNYHA